MDKQRYEAGLKMRKEVLGAEYVEVDSGHWSLVECPTLGAEALSALWESAR